MTCVYCEPKSRMMILLVMNGASKGSGQVRKICLNEQDFSTVAQVIRKMSMDGSFPLTIPSTRMASA
jgi:hypothetical protein